MSSAGVWTNFTEYLKSWLVFRPRNCLCRLYQNLKPKNLAFFFFQVMSTPQMFTMLHVSIKYFSYAISDQTCSGTLISYMCIYFFSLVYVFHLLKCIFRKLWLDLTLSTVWMSDRKPVHFSWTRHTNTNITKTITRNGNNIKM